MTSNHRSKETKKRYIAGVAALILIALAIFFVYNKLNKPVVDTMAQERDSTAADVSPTPTLTPDEVVVDYSEYMERPPFYDIEGNCVVVDKNLLIDPVIHEDTDDIKLEYSFSMEWKVLPDELWEAPAEGIKQITLHEYGLTIHTEAISAFLVTEDEESFYISAVSPKEKYPVVVILDPGHGGNDAGTVNGEIYEKDINLRIALRLLDVMKQEESNGIKCYLTRHADEWVELEDRVSFANANGSFMLSIHNNSWEDPEVRGSTGYFRTHVDIDKPFTSKELCYMIQDNLVATLSSNDRSIEYSDVFYVLNHTLIPTIITEAGFITNEEELKLLLSDSYIDKIAQGYYLGIMEAAEYFS